MTRTLATMITMTTYGSWLRGDRRGWVDKGQILPPEPFLEAADRRRMKHPLYRFSDQQLHRVGELIGTSLVNRMNVALLALSVGTWHCHFVIGVTEQHVGDVVKCAKDAVRHGLQPGRPIWTTGL